MLIDRYFEVRENDFYTNYKLQLMPTKKSGVISSKKESPTLSLINAFTVYKKSDIYKGLHIVKIRMNEKTADIVRSEMEKKEKVAPTELSFTRAIAIDLELENSFLGDTLEEVIAIYPKLRGTEKVDDGDGGTMEVPIIKDVIIA